jgi:hypothetical protein
MLNINISWSGNGLIRKMVVYFIISNRAGGFCEEEGGYDKGRTSYNITSGALPKYDLQNERDNSILKYLTTVLKSFIPDHRRSPLPYR